MIFLAFYFISCSEFRKLPKLDPESENFYHLTHLLMTKYEKEIFFLLKTKKQREEFIKEFWEIRDPDPYTEINEYKIEIEKRFRYAEKYFREPGRPGWDTDRGRIYILLGPPNEIRDYPMLSGRYKAVQIWYYGNFRLVLEFVDEKGDGILRLNNYPPELINAMEEAKYQIMSGDEILFKRKLVKFKPEYIGSGEIALKIKPKTVSFKRDETGNLYFKFRINMIFYYKDKNIGAEFVKKSFEESIKKREEDFLREKWLKIKIKPNVRKGKKVYIDIIVIDLLSGGKGRKLLKIKNFGGK